MLRDISYVYPPKEKPIFVVNAHKKTGKSATPFLLSVTAIIICITLLSTILNGVMTLTVIALILLSAAAYGFLRKSNADPVAEVSHPELAVFKSGIWFFRYDTFIPFERFFRAWVSVGTLRNKERRHVMFEIYLRNEDVDSVIKRRQYLGHESFHIEGNIHHKTKLNDVLCIRVPYYDGQLDHTHEEVIQKISSLIEYDAYAHSLPVDTGIEQ